MRESSEGGITGSKELEGWEKHEAWVDSNLEHWPGYLAGHRLRNLCDELNCVPSNSYIEFAGTQLKSYPSASQCDLIWNMGL